MSRTKIGTTRLAALAAALLFGCKTVSYDDPNKVETVTADFGSTDLQTIAAAMCESLLRHPSIAGDRSPVVYFGGVENATSEHIDMKAVADTIRTSLARSGKVRFTADRSGQMEIQDQIAFQTGEYVDPATAKKKGRQIGAEYVLAGRFASIVKKDDSRKDVYYLFTLSLENIESALIEWTDQKEIRKGEKRSLFGW
jgi:hypothetical protein